VRLHRADDSERQSHKLTALEKDAEGTWISIPEGFSIGDEVYLIQSKAGFFPKKPFFHPVLPRNLDSYSHAPGHDSAPVFSLPVEKTEKKRKKFPPGMYVQISQVEDLYMIQSVRPERVLLDYTRKTAEHLLGDRPGPLPFSPQELILVLDPYFPQDMEPTFAEEIPALRELGYRCFVVNNLGHFSYFRSGEEDLIAGPYLYVFNRWANKFIADLGIRYFVSPLENNRQNLERTVEPNRRGFAFIPVFGYPALFRLRADLRGIYDFGGFSDSRGQRFFLENERDGSIVTPERPFSIVDKIPFLQEAGFERFIVALKRMKKKDYKEVMQAVAKAAPLPNISRFNWKDGFYRSD
jgi:putative protease